PHPGGEARLDARPERLRGHLGVGLGHECGEANDPPDGRRRYVRAESQDAMAHAALAGSLGHNLFDLDLSVVEKVSRSLIVFVFLAFALRLGGKRELAQLNVLDLAVLLLASNALQNALIGDDSTVTGGLLGAATLFAA